MKLKKRRIFVALCLGIRTNNYANAASDSNITVEILTLAVGLDLECKVNEEAREVLAKYLEQYDASADPATVDIGGARSVDRMLLFRGPPRAGKLLKWRKDGKGLAACGANLSVKRRQTLSEGADSYRLNVLCSAFDEIVA